MRTMPDYLTRDDARAFGSRRFFTGKPCRRGHVCERYVSGEGCVECHAARNKIWAARSRLKLDAYNKAHGLGAYRGQV